MNPDLPSLQSFLCDSYTFYKMGPIQLENIPSLKPENIILNAFSFIGVSSISQSNAVALFEAISRENQHA